MYKQKINPAAGLPKPVRSAGSRQTESWNIPIGHQLPSPMNASDFAYPDTQSPGWEKEVMFSTVPHQNIVRS